MDLLAPVGDRENGPFGPFIEEFRMTAADFAAIVLALGLGNQGMADALGVDVRRVRAYSSGGRRGRGRSVRVGLSRRFGTA